MYDLNECIQFVVQKLTVNGFYVKYFFPRVLYISWGPSPQQQALPAPSQPQPQAQSKSKVKNQNTKSIKMASKQKGKFVLDLT